MQGTSAWHTGGASCVMSLRSEHLGLGSAAPHGRGVHWAPLLCSSLGTETLFPDAGR